MFGRTEKKTLAAINQVMGRHYGGIYKRIDENRELLELLVNRAPSFIGAHPWVISWFLSGDSFLSALAEIYPPKSPAMFDPSTQFPGSIRRPRDFPCFDIRAMKNAEWETQQSNDKWKTHAYPLQQVTIQLQGTRYSDKAAIIKQLETVMARLKAGETCGKEEDDDFGYAFEYTSAVSGLSFFSGPCRDAA